MNIGKMGATAAFLLASTGTAQAALVDRGGGMIYDTTLDITWLADWNYAQTSGYPPANQNSLLPTYPLGAMNWSFANAWVNDLVYGGFSDWRLPAVVQPDPTCSDQFLFNNTLPQSRGFNCTGGEMGHMFYVDWGATAGNPYSSGTNAANLALFSNVQTVAFYYSSTFFAPSRGGSVWIFSESNGTVELALTDEGVGYAVAVRDGDVAASVPEPQTLALALLGLGAAIFGWRRRVGQRERVLRRLGIA